MVKLNKIYTRTGDDGTTGLGTGERRQKSDLRVEAYGTVDEANSCIGLARLHTGALLRPSMRCWRASRTICSTSAPISRRPTTASRSAMSGSRIIASQTARIEAEIDELNAGLQPLRSFVLPGGSPAAAALHLARTVARRAERIMVALAAKPGEQVNAEGLRYINRVSDFLFVAARAVNDNGNADVLWVPGKNR